MRSPQIKCAARGAGAAWRFACVLLISVHAAAAGGAEAHDCPAAAMTNALVAASIDVLDVASAEPTSAAGTSTSFATALNATKSGEADGSSVFQNVRELLFWTAKGLALVVGSALVLASAVPLPGSAARSSAWRAPVVGYLLFSGGASLARRRLASITTGLRARPLGTRLRSPPTVRFRMPRSPSSGRSRWRTAAGG